MCRHAVADEANLETEGKRIPFRISSSVMYDARLHCKNKQMFIQVIVPQEKQKNDSNQIRRLWNQYS